MPSGLDILEGKVPTVIVSGPPMDTFDVKVPEGADPTAMARSIVAANEPKAKTGLDLLSTSTPTPQPITPVIPQPAINPAAYDPLALFGKIVPKATTPKPVITKEESSGAMLALNKVWGLAKNPYDVVKGTAEFVASIPGFIEGVGGATWEASKAIGKGANLSQAYEAASKGMEEMSADWKYKMVDPLGRLLDTPKTLGKLAAEKVTGVKSKEEENYSEVVGDVAMAPLNLVTKAAHSIADAGWLDEYPNTKGAIKFGGDALGLLFMGRLYKGGPEEFAKDVEPIIKKADAINKQQKVIDEIPNEVLKKAQEKVLEVQKVQLELEAKALQDKLDHQKVVEEDLRVKGQEVKDIKEGKVPVEEELLPNTEFDDALLGDLGYEKDEIAQMSVEERANILKVDETVSPLNELDQFEPANIPTKIGIDTSKIPNKDLQPLVDRIYKTYDKNEHLGELDYPEGFFKTGKKADQVEIIQDFIDANAEDVGLLYETFGDLGKPKTKAAEVKAITSGVDILEPKKAKVIKRKGKVKEEVTEGTPITIYRGRAKEDAGKVQGEAQFYTTSKERAQEFADTNIEGGLTPEVVTRKVTLKKIAREKDILQAAKEEGKYKKGDTWAEEEPIDLLDESEIVSNLIKKGFDGVVTPEHRTGGEYLNKIKNDFVALLKNPYEEPRPITDLDLQTGTPLPDSLSTQAHPFRDKSPEHTNSMRKLLQERVNNIEATPEVFTRYLINEVNRYLNGEEVPIDKVRNGLSELATRAESLRPKFDIGDDFTAWRDTVKAAASWARGADRLTNKRTGGTNLNMMIPINEAPKIVKDILKNIKGAAQDLYRNKEVFDSTGFWLAKDGKWRYEIDSSKLRVKDELFKGDSISIENAIDYPDLFKAVPELKEVQIKVDTKLDTLGNYNPDNKMIRVKDPSEDLIVHEVQHAVNDVMKSRFTGTNAGFEQRKMILDLLNNIKRDVSNGDVKIEVTNIIHKIDKKSINTTKEINKLRDMTSSKKDRGIIESSFSKYLDSNAIDNYKKDPGEMEARLSEARLNMTPEERKNTPPWKTLDGMIYKEELKTDKSGHTLYMGLDPTEFYNTIKNKLTKLIEENGPKEEIRKTKDHLRLLSFQLDRVHPATYPVKLVNALATITNKLKVDSVLDIFGGVGKIGRIKDYGYNGKVIANELEPSWKGVDTKELHKNNKVDETIIGDARNINLPDSSIGAIVTSPTYGNRLGQSSNPSNYASFTDNGLTEGNTGALTWGPKYEQLHSESYKESYRVVKPGGFFILNMKDSPVNKYIPEKGSTVSVKGGMMNATKWHVDELNKVGFETVRSYRLKESEATASNQQAIARAHTTGYENIVIMRKPGGAKIDSKIFEDISNTIIKVQRQSPSKLELTFYMGLDPTQISEATKKIIAGAKALANYTAKARGMKEWKPGVAAENIKKELVRSFVDRSGNIRKELLDKLGQDGYEIIQKMYLSKGASSLAAQQLKQMRNEVYDGLTKNDKRILDNLILADRMLDIGKYKTASQFKFPEGLSPVESASYNELFQFTEKITPKKAELLKQRAASYFDWMKKPLQDMLDAELIDQTEYDALASHNYRRLKLVDVFDKRYQSKVGKTKRTVYDSGVESLSHGRETDVFEPSSEVMALEVFNRAYGRILNNAANRTLLDLARTDKDNPFVAVKDSATDRVPSGWDRVFVYEKGERKALYLSPEMSKEWITNNPEMSYKFSQMIRYASGSPVLRTFATGIDWDFALRNLPRDVMHIWYAARVFEDGKWKPLYNTASPVYAYQMSADLAGVFHDATLRKGRYLDYIKEGGGMEFLVHQGRLMQRGRHIEGNIDKVQNVLGYVGETSEIMTRLAIRDRVIRRRAAEQGISYEDAYKDKKITQEATFVARDYMDFGQGGGIVKALDNGIPYLSASVQGTRGLLRAFKDNPTQSTAKLAQFATVVTGLYIAANQFNPKTMQALQGDMITQSNIVLPLGDEFSFQDEKGQTRYIYLKLLPLDPGQKFFKKFFEASTDKWLGNPVDVDGTVNALSQLSPVGISSLPPTVAGALGYTYNKNFWSAEDIWKKTDKPMGWPNSKEEYIPGKTPQAFQDFGSLTGMSPERTKYAVSQLFTSGTMWGQLVGAGYDAVFGDLPKKYKEMHLAEILSKMPITKNFIGITNPYTQFATPINEAKEQAMLKRWVENRGLDQRVESFLYEGGKRADVIDYIQATAKDQNTQDRLKDRFIFQEKIKALPNRAFWLSLKSIPDTEARAKVFVQRFDSAPQGEQEQMNKEIGIVISAGGVISDEFKQEVMKERDRQARKKTTP